MYQFSLQKMSTLRYPFSLARRVPFEVTFLSDDVELAEADSNEGARGQNGFRITYEQDDNCQEIVTPP